MDTVHDVVRWALRWSVAGLGGLVLLVPLVYTVVIVGSPVEVTRATAVPVAVAFALVIFGAWLARFDFAPSEIQRIAAWCTGGLLVLTALGAWEAYLHVLEGEPLTDSLHEVMVSGATGSGIGAVVGYYDVGQWRQRRQAERARRAMEASIDGMAVLDDDGEYVAVNQAHADAYGYDGPDAFVGESWHMCYTDDEVERFENDIMPGLAAEGRWRGEAAGLRADGRTYPQEVSLTAMADGGLVCVVRDISERTERERGLEALNRASRELLAASTPPEIASVATEIAQEALDYDMAGFWEYDEASGKLVPAAFTEPARDFSAEKGTEIGPIVEGTYEMEVFRDGELTVVQDYGEIEHPSHPDVPLGTIALIPIGEYGLLSVGGSGTTEIPDADRRLLDILAHNATAAFDGARHRQDLEAANARFRALTENSPVGVVSIDQNSTVEYASPAFEHILGYQADDIVGESITTLMPERLRGAHREAIERYVTTGERSLDWGGIELPGLHADGHEVPLEISFGEYERGGEHLFTGIVRDISERARQEEQIRSLQEATPALADATTTQAVAATAVDIAADVLDQPLSVMWSYVPDADELVPMSATDEVTAFTEGQGLDDSPPAFGPGSLEMQAFRRGETRVIDEYRSEDSGDGPTLPLGTVVLVPLAEHGLLGVGSTERRTVSTPDRYLVDILARHVEAALDRVEREHRLEMLQEFTREMVRATDEKDVYDITAEAAREVLNLPLNTVWTHEAADEDPDPEGPHPAALQADGADAPTDIERERLRPVSWTAEADALFDEMPTYPADEQSISWEAFETGESRLFQDLREHPQRYNPETPLRSEIVVPVGDHGVLNAGSTEPNVFTETDLTLARMLTANAAVALDRVKRETLLRQQTEDLERLTSQLEFFNSILRHDVLNGMTVVRGRAQMLAEACDEPHRSHAETIVRWCDDVTDVIGRVRSVLETLTDPENRSFEPVDLSAMVRTELDRVEGTYPEVTFEREIPDDVTVQADELLPEVLGNVLTNAVEHNDESDLRVTVRVEPGDPVRVTIADNGRGVPHEHRDAIFRRGETGHAKSTGSGFGLFFVDSMVTAYGGTVRVEDAPIGGAAFVLELPAPESEGK